MTQSALPTWEMWDMKPPPLPPRSQLYHLAPLGMGTPFVEGLSSYLLRLAEAHHVVPLQLMHYVGDTVAEKCNISSLTLSNSQALNSYTGLAQRWVSALSSLTLRSDLCFLTMLPWSRVFGVIGLMHRHLHWCPDCWHAWREVGTPLYLPLLWSVEVATICLRHQRPLQNHCPHCRHKQPAMAGLLWLGYCLHCRRELIPDCTPDPAEAAEREDAAVEQQRWNTQAVGSLLAAAPTLPTPPDETMMAHLAEQWITHLGQGNIKATARLLNVSSKVIGRWRKNQKVTLRTFLAACYTSDITPLAVFTQEQILLSPPAAAPSRETVSLPSVSETAAPDKRPHNWRRHDQEKLRRHLDAVIADNEYPPPRIEDVASRLGCSITIISRNFPEQHQTIIQRRQRYREEQAQEKRRAIEQTLAAEMGALQPQSVIQIAARFGHSGPWLSRHFPEQARAISRQCQAYEAAQQEQKTQELRQALAEALACNEWPPPTVKEVLARLPFPTRFVYKHCGEQCHALAARYATYRREKNKERANKIQALVRQAVQEIHAQGDFPSRCQVGLRLPTPMMMIPTYAREAYREAMLALGYDMA